MAARNFELDEVRDYRPCWEPDEVMQVLEGLDRLAKRASKHVLQRRRTERKPYTAGVLITQNRRGRMQDGGKALLHVVARNLSRSGVGLLAPLFFEPEIPSPDSPMLRSANVFREGAVLEIGLWKPNATLLWLYGSVIRARTVQHDFLDVGVRFNGRRNVTQELDLE